MEMCRWSTVAFLVSGAVFLAFRFCKTTETAYFVFGAAVCFGAALLTAYFRARYKLPDEERLTVFLSSLVPGGGVVLSAAECGTFPERFPALPELPKLRFEKIPLLFGALFASILFAAGALYVPLSLPRQPDTPKTLDLKDEAEKISDGLKTLRRSSPEGEKKALPLQKELEETLQKADPAANTVQSEKFHVVKSGDTLGSIARKYYGRASMEDVIFDANTKVIKNRNRLSIGMRLVIPEL